MVKKLKNFFYFTFRTLKMKLVSQPLTPLMCFDISDDFRTLGVIRKLRKGKSRLFDPSACRITLTFCITEPYSVKNLRLDQL